MCQLSGTVGQRAMPDLRGRMGGWPLAMEEGRDATEKSPKGESQRLSLV